MSGDLDREERGKDLRKRKNKEGRRSRKYGEMT